jgi:hypothetical protein
MPSPDEPDKITPKRKLRQRRWLKRIETLIPQMFDTAKQKGGTTVAYLGQRPLPDGRVVEVSLKARIDQDSGGTHKLR